MAALEDFDEYLTERHEALEAGSEFSLVELMGKRWAEIEALGQETAFGTLYSKAAKASRFPRIRYVKIADNGRHNLYRKLREDELDQKPDQLAPESP